MLTFFIPRKAYLMKKQLYQTIQPRYKLYYIRKKNYHELFSVSVEVANISLKCPIDQRSSSEVRKPGKKHSPFLHAYRVIDS